jgi:hypothetical protein
MREKEKNRRIYIVITQTGTILSRILKFVTGAEYNHASISLAPDLSIMYSFGRRRPYNPFWAGFVTESTSAGTFKRFSNTRAIVLAINVREDQYSALRLKIDAMLAARDAYHYNYLGLGLAAFNIHYRRARHYYCSEFVRELLLNSDISGCRALAPIVQPIHFLDIPGVQRVFQGKLSDYAVPCLSV